MDVKVAKTAGFCFGVKRAVEEVYRVAEVTQGAVYTLSLIQISTCIRDRHLSSCILPLQKDLNRFCWCQLLLVCFW